MYHETKDEILNNPFLCNMETEVSRFGLWGTFALECCASNLQDRGLYFLCGYHREQVQNATKQINALYFRQQREDRIRLDLHICKITDRSAFNIHQEVMEYCLRACVMDRLCNWAGAKTPDLVCPAFLQLCLSLCRSFTDPERTPQEKCRLKQLLKNCILNRENWEERAEKAKMAPAKIKKTAPENHVTLPDLLCEAMSTVKKTVPVSQLSRILKELEENPRLHYYQTATFVPELPLPSRLFRCVEKFPDLATVTFAVDADHEETFDMIRINSSHYSGTSRRYLQSKRIDYCRFGIREEDLPAVMAWAQQAKIKLCLDKNEPYFSYLESGSCRDRDGFALICALRDIDQVKGILLSLAKDSAAYFVHLEKYLSAINDVKGVDLLD